MRDENVRWNLNTHYHRVFLNAIPAGASTALDIGCGDGLMTFDLAERGLDVTGIDLDGAIIERARTNPRASARTDFINENIFTAHLQPASFDLVAASAVLHHVDARAGIRRMKELVRPGGVIVVVGFGRPDGLADRVLAVAGALTKRLQIMRRRYWEHSAPVMWPPPCTTSEMRVIGSEELPGASFRRLMSNRYSLVWTAPVK